MKPLAILKRLLGSLALAERMCVGVCLRLGKNWDSQVFSYISMPRRGIGRKSLNHFKCCTDLTSNKNNISFL